MLLWNRKIKTKLSRPPYFKGVWIIHFMNTRHVLKNIIHPERQRVQFSTFKLGKSIYISIYYKTKEPKKITWVFSLWLGMKMSRPNLTLRSRKIKTYFIWVSWLYFPRYYTKIYFNIYHHLWELWWLILSS